MSAKKKNPLKDLSAFLAHQEETTKVPQPKKISEAEAFLEKKPTQITNVSRPAKIAVTDEVNAETIKNLLIDLSENKETDFRIELYDIIKGVLEKLNESTPADKMLINTVLYLANQDNWKEAVKTYWEN
ncbi:MAG: hypothetical protein OEW67_08995 [Cyclobacteriaceae bacterium]|nr:hypothetical protein [Cyclobacteriaceae bacterium]